jgi:DNA-binding transcriptional MocR family regulator
VCSCLRSAHSGSPANQTLQLPTAQIPYTADYVRPSFLALQGYSPLVSWAHNMVASLHHPATLLPQPNPSAATFTNSSSAEPIGMQVVMTQGSSAALDCVFRMLLNPGDPVLLEEYTYAHVVEADLLPMR